MKTKTKTKTEQIPLVSSIKIFEIFKFFIRYIKHYVYRTRNLNKILLHTLALDSDIRKRMAT